LITKADGTKFGKSEGEYLVDAARNHHINFTNIG
jgi:tyrosyl-tRNA synthetase